MTWQTKKKLHYQEPPGKIILNIRNLGLHYTPEGIKVIKNILSQMNNNRIAIKKRKSRCKSKVLQKLLMAEVHKLLSRGSNYEVM